MSVPNAADWLTAVGTVGTLAATVTLFWIDRYQRQKRADSAQAAMISGWAEPVEIGAPTRAVVVANRSDEPVYRINVFLEDEDNQDENHEIVATEIRSDSVNTRYLSVLPPMQQVLLKVNRKNPNSSGPRTVPRVYLLFDDRNSKRWARDFRGSIRIRPADDPEKHRTLRSGSDLSPGTRSSTSSLGSQEAST
jgi:hypothetical protein